MNQTLNVRSTETLRQAGKYPSFDVTLRLHEGGWAALIVALVYARALTALRSSWRWAALDTVRPATIVGSVYVGSGLISF